MFYQSGSFLPKQIIEAQRMNCALHNYHSKSKEGSQTECVLCFFTGILFLKNLTHFFQTDWNFDILYSRYHLSNKEVLAPGYSKPYLSPLTRSTDEWCRFYTYKIERKQCNCNFWIRKESLVTHSSLKLGRRSSTSSSAGLPKASDMLRRTSTTLLIAELKLP